MILIPIMLTFTTSFIYYLTFCPKWWQKFFNSASLSYLIHEEFNKILFCIIYLSIQKKAESKYSFYCKFLTSL